MHSSSYGKTTIVYNSDYSGPIVIVANGHSIETDIKAIEQFIENKKRMEKIAKLENGDEIV